MPRTLIYPGTFDPFTLGHLDLTERAGRIASRVVVAVAENGGKNPMFSLEQRLALVSAACAHLPQVEVCSFSGLLIDLAQAENADMVLRGLRSGTDLDYERPMADLNRRLLPGLEVIFMLPAAELAAISSTLVREIHRLGGQTQTLVPDVVQQALTQRGKHGTSDHR